MLDLGETMTFMFIYDHYPKQYLINISEKKNNNYL